MADMKVFKQIIESISITIFWKKKLLLFKKNTES